MEDDDNNKDDNNDKGISTLGLDRDLGFSRGHQGCQGHRPHDDDDDEEDNEVEDNSKDDNSNKDDNNDKGISALGLDRDRGFCQVIKGIGLMMMTMIRWRTKRWRTTTSTMTTMTRVSQLWD